MDNDIKNENIVELINAGDGNAYHLLMYMFMNFILCDVNSPIIYYYGKPASKLAEMFMSLLPPNFIRHTVKDPKLKYKPFLPEEKFTNDRFFLDPEWALPFQYDFLRELFVPHYKENNRPGLYIYVSRNNDSKVRRVKNEDQLLKVIKPFGFKVVTMSELSVKKQIKIFAEADIILSPHGAALTYLLFSNQQQTVMEFVTSNNSAKHYWHIAWHRGLDYYRFLSDKDDNNDLIVDIEQLKGFLEYHPKIRRKIDK